jgi:hypothetical protein
LREFFLCGRYHRGHNVACLAKGRAVFDLSPVARAAGAVAQVAPLDGTRVIHSITSSAKCEQPRWQFEAERRSSFEIDHELKSGWLGDRQVGRLRALENTTGIHARLATRIENRTRVANQSADFYELAMTLKRRKTVTRCKRDQWFAELLAENTIGGDK